jgi:tetratricopeptide (TPR) repeat protein
MKDPKDWFRNEVWTTEIEKEFFRKLARARKKDQYLRIQAHTLLATSPETSLKLLDEFIKLSEPFGLAQAHADRAAAFLNLDRFDEAVAEFVKALNQEEIKPSNRTRAFIDLPIAIVTRKKTKLFDLADKILEANRSMVRFPLDRFLFNYAKMRIALHSGDTSAAKGFANGSIDAATEKESGFQNARYIGLVGVAYTNMIEEARAISQSAGIDSWNFERRRWRLL